MVGNELVRMQSANSSVPSLSLLLNGCSFLVSQNHMILPAHVYADLESSVLGR